MQEVSVDKDYWQRAYEEEKQKNDKLVERARLIHNKLSLPALLSFLMPYALLSSTEWTIRWLALPCLFMAI